MPRPRRSSAGSNAPIIVLGVVVGLLLFGVAAVLFIGPWYQLTKNQNIFFDMKDLRKKSQYEKALSLAAEADPTADTDTWKKVQDLKAEIEADIRGRDKNLSGDNAQREMWALEKWIKNHRDDHSGIVAKWEAYIEKYRGTVWAGHGKLRLEEVLTGGGFAGNAVDAGDPDEDTGGGGGQIDVAGLDTGGDAKIDRAFRAALKTAKSFGDRDEFGAARDAIEDFWENNQLLAEDTEDWLSRKERAIRAIEDRAKGRWGEIDGRARAYVDKGEYEKARNLYRGVMKTFGLEKYETLGKLELEKIAE